jgi:putative holliday junction resolvase
MARVLGVDLGARRIGLAATDETQTLASPLAMLERSGDPTRDHRAIIETARDIGAERIVVGLPISLSGREGPAAEAVRAEVEELRVLSEPEIAVCVHDERFTTSTAERSLREAGTRRRDRRAKIDAAAAAVMLQSWLEGA